MASITDVAEMANVSLMTVSRVLRGKGLVKQDTRSRVLKAMEHYSYIPSNAARAMRSGDELRKTESSCFGLIFGADICAATSFFCDIAKSAEEEAANNGLCPIQVNWQKTSEETWPRLQTILSMQGLCGLILVGQFSEDVVRKLQDKIENIVMVDGPCSPHLLEVGSVEADNFGGAKLALGHFCDTGVKKVLVLSGAPKEHYFSQALQAASLFYKDKFDVIDIEYTPLNGESARKRVLDLWKSGHYYDGIFSDDEMAIGVLRAMSEIGMSVPKDVKVIGFDDVPYASLTVPTLTTINIDKAQLGTEAVQMLVNMVRGQKDVAMVKKLIRARLVIRESA